MSDDNTNTPATNQGDDPQATPPQAVPTDVKPPDRVPIGEMLEWRKKAKASAAELDQLRQQMQEIEDRDKTEAQKAVDEAQRAQQELAALKSENLRMKVAQEAELPAKLQKFLNGKTEEELRSNAEELKAAMVPPTPPRPTPDPTQGAKPGTAGTVQLTEADVARMTPEQVVEAQEKGQLNEYMGIT